MKIWIQINHFSRNDEWKKKKINAKEKKKELKCFCLRTRCVYDMPWHTKKEDETLSNLP